MTWTCSWNMIGERAEVWDRLKKIPERFALKISEEYFPEKMVLVSQDAEGGELALTLEKSGVTTQVTANHEWSDVVFWHIPDQATWWAMMDELGLVPKETDIALADHEIL